ncbi:MAG: hypothetical protein E7361_00010 [Clostridiales bacterium]|nr:hypothetical protein [Clostridiales bacterium]
MKIFNAVKRDLLYKKFNIRPERMKVFEDLFLPENNVVDFDKMSEQQRREIEIDSILLPAEEYVLMGLTKDTKGKSFIARQYDVNIDPVKTGHRNKEFVMCDSLAFGELITELQSDPNSSYVTYNSDIIKEGITPKYISALMYYKPNTSFTNESAVKKMLTKTNPIISEVLSSRILNFMDIPTVYNTFALLEENKDEELSTGNKAGINVLSVDFIGKNERFMSTSDIIEDSLWSLPGLLPILENNNKVIKYYYLVTQSPEKIDRATELATNHTIDNYLTHSLLLKNTDYMTDNYGWIINDATLDIHPAPAYDLEFTLEDKLDVYSINRNDIEYIKEHYPKRLDQFIDKCNQLIATNDKGVSPLDNMISSLAIDEKLATNYRDIIHHNIAIINDLEHNLIHQPLDPNIFV